MKFPETIEILITKKNYKKKMSFEYVNSFQNKPEAFNFLGVKSQISWNSDCNILLKHYRDFPFWI